MLTLLLSSVMCFYHVQVPVATLRQGPALDKEIVSQVLFAEEVKMLDTQNEWIQIQSLEDGSLGWIQRDDVVRRETAYADCSCITPLVEVNQLSAHVYEKQNRAYGPLFTLPFESRLEALDPFEDPDSPWIAVRLPDDTQAYVQRGDVTADIHAIPLEKLVAFSKRFLNVPFTQGGRSSFGYDSSGFIQMLYKQIGVSLPRSVQEQYNWEGLETTSIEELTPGDLIFWGLSNTEIQHVGLFIGDNQFIHATSKENPPWLKISVLDTPLYKGEGEWTYRTGCKLK